MKKAIKEAPQDTAEYYRSRALICRQQAVLHPEASWRWLSEAERLEHLAVQQPKSASASATAVRRPAAA